MTRHSYQPASRATRFASGFVGALIGLTVVVAVVESMGAQSGGQPLGEFVAAQRAIAAQPMAQALPVEGAPVALPLAADAV